MFTLPLALLAALLAGAGAFDCVESSLIGGAAQGDDCCNNFYTGCICPEGTCCDFNTGKCLASQTGSTVEHCEDNAYNYRNLASYASKSVHGTCENFCQCRCNCGDDQDCANACDCAPDPNPCEPYCFFCDEDDKDDEEANCRKCASVIY